MAPRRFRRRLAVAVTLIAATAAGLLALASAILVPEYRARTFRNQAVAKAELSLLSARGDLSLERFEALLAEYRARGGFDTLAVSGDVVYSSEPLLTRDDIPESIDVRFEAGESRPATTSLAGEPHFVIGGSPIDSDTRFFFFFSEAELRDSIEQLRLVLFLGWVVVTVMAGLVGHRVARRTLRPVREAAEASRALAEGLLDTRLDWAENDEFGMWASSFNEMAAALHAKIDALAAAAARERQFTADVAHELRTPLTGLVTAAELLEGSLDEIPPEGRRPAEILIADVRRLRALVLELLELARMDAGTETVTLEPIAIREAVEAVVAPWRARGAAVDVRVDNGLLALADRARFRRAMANLIGNAVTHGGRDVAVRAEARSPERVAIVVEDRGPGLPPDADRLFDRFFKGDASRSSGGSGLGLAIARDHARAQGGDIVAANREGGGAAFTLLLRVAPVTTPLHRTVDVG